MSNMISSNGIPNGPPQQGFGGVLFAASNLAVSRKYAMYYVVGTAVIASLTSLPKGASFALQITDGATFKHSDRLLCPGSVDFVALAGAFVILASQGDGKWRLLSPGVASLNGKTGAVAAYFPPQGRLTLTSGTPVMATSATAQTTVYYTPYVGNLISVYDGSNVVPTPFAELSVSTTDTTKSPAAIGASKVNDWFVWDDGGTLRLGHGPDWTNDTTRSAGAALVMVNGIWVNNVSITNGPAASRGTYVGTTRSNGSSSIDYTFGSVATGGGAASFGVWNAYNRVSVCTMVGDDTNSWTYATANTWRAPNGSTTMRVSAVRGLNVDGVAATYSALSQAGASTNAISGIGLNSTTALAASATTGIQNQGSGSGLLGAHSAKFSGLMGLGFNYLSALEQQSTTTSCTWYGDAGGPGTLQSGLHAELWQ